VVNETTLKTHFEIEEERVSFNKANETGIEVEEASKNAIKTMNGIQSKLEKAVQLATCGRKKATGRKQQELRSHGQQTCDDVGRQITLHSTILPIIQSAISRTSESGVQREDQTKKTSTLLHTITSSTKHSTSTLVCEAEWNNGEYRSS